MRHSQGLIICLLIAASFIEVVMPHRTQDTDATHGVVQTVSRRSRRSTGGHRNYLEEDSLDRRHQLQQQQQLLAANRYPEAGVPVNTPEFVTLGQKYSVAIGSTIVLPCKINESEPSGHYVLAWKRDIAVLTAGDIKVTMNPRIRLMPSQQQQQQHNTQQQSLYRQSASHRSGLMQINMPSSSSSSSSSSLSSLSLSSTPDTSSLQSSSYNLEIQSVRANDAGEYACQIGTLVPKEIVHSLEVLVPPTINYMAPSTKLEVPKGASIKLECKATGNPAPAIIWSRKNNVMPNGEANITNNILEMMHADRHTVGQYKCTADNRVGTPDQRDIFVNVLYAPEIEVEFPFVHTGVGYDTQLVCIVHAEPTAQVVWYKHNTQMGITEQHSQQNHGNRYMLIVRNVTVSDLGNYTCQATNHFGKDRATLTLSGIPSMCEFTDSPRVSPFHDQYNISWTVQSYAPILEYRLYHRRQSNNSHRFHYGNMQSQQQSIFNGIAHHQQQQQQAQSTSQQLESSAEWEDVVIIPQQSSFYGGSSHNPMGGGGVGGGGNLLGTMPGATSFHPRGTTYQSNSNTGRHRTSYLITNLRSASNYEVRVQARNVHGWNKLSATFHFSTPAFEVEDNKPHPNGVDFRPLTQQSSSRATTITGKFCPPIVALAPVYLIARLVTGLIGGGGPSSAAVVVR